MPQALTPAQIRLLIATNLADASNITAAEHRAVEEALIDYSEEIDVALDTVNAVLSEAKVPVYIGMVQINALTNTNPVGTDLIRAGNFTYAKTEASVGSDTIQFRVGLPTPFMNSLNYTVVFTMEINSSNPPYQSAHILSPVFRINSVSEFSVGLKRENGSTPGIKLHMEIYNRNY